MCPYCGNRSPRHLENASRDGLVDYYRCDPCGCTWTKPKDDANGRIRIVNYRAKDADRQRLG